MANSRAYFPHFEVARPSSARPHRKRAANRPPLIAFVDSSVSRHREVGSVKATHYRLDSKHVRVVRLEPLDRTRVEEFVRSHADDLAGAATTPDAVMGFIDRTYDLTDLATRPLLLTLIVDSVLLGGLDVDDAAVQFGPSGLYEIYTQG